MRASLVRNSRQLIGNFALRLRARVYGVRGMSTPRYRPQFRDIERYEETEKEREGWVLASHRQSKLWIMCTLCGSVFAATPIAVIGKRCLCTVYFHMLQSTAHVSVCVRVGFACVCVFLSMYDCPFPRSCPQINHQARNTTTSSTQMMNITNTTREQNNQPMFHFSLSIFFFSSPTNPTSPTSFDFPTAVLPCPWPWKKWVQCLKVNWI